jgi:hypothetical protein
MQSQVSVVADRYRARHAREPVLSGEIIMAGEPGLFEARSDQR